MRVLRIPLLALVVTVALAGVSNAQIVDCDDIIPSQADTVRFNFAAGPPGTVFDLPLYIRNAQDLATFQIYVEYDSTLIKPLVDTIEVDPVDLTATYFYQYTVENRFLHVDSTFDNISGEWIVDTTTAVQVINEPDFPASGNKLARLKIIALIDLSGVDPDEPDFEIPTAIVAGAGTVMRLKFQMLATTALDSLTTINFYDAASEIRDTVFPFDVIRRDCVYSRYGDPSGIADVRFTVQPSGARASESSPTPPVINSFTASPQTLPQGGGQVTLSWNVTNSSQISISPGVGTFTEAISSTTTNITTNTTFTLTASNTAGSVSQSRTVTIGSSSNNPPVIAQISGSPFTINQGETVAFTVTATDADNNQITLTATSLPPNATFSQAVGQGTVSSNFSFTPDFNQTGTAVATFRADDGQGGITTLSVPFTIIEIISDRLFSTSAPGQRPVGALSGRSGIYFPINMITAQTVYGVQFEFFYDFVFFSVDSFVTTGRTAEYIVYDNIGQTPGGIRVVTLGLANEPIQTVEDTTAILYAVMTIDPAATFGDYPVYLENGWESIDPDPFVPGLELVTDSGIIQVDTLGDVNLDKHINVADLVNIVAHIINNFTLNTRQFETADVITNDTVDVFDLVGVVNLIFQVPVIPNPAPPLQNDKAYIALDYPDLGIGSADYMMVHTEEISSDIAAVELDIDYDPAAVTLGKPEKGGDATALDLRYRDDGAGRMKVLLYFTNPVDPNRRIAAGDQDLVTIPITAKQDLAAGDTDKLRITKALLSTADAAKVEVGGISAPPGNLPGEFILSQNYPNPFNPTTNIDYTIYTPGYVSLEIYNVIGQRVRRLVDERKAAGSYTVEWDATDERGSKVASGIYLYRLTFEDGTKSRKMLLLK